MEATTNYAMLESKLQRGTVDLLVAVIEPRRIVTDIIVPVTSTKERGYLLVRFAVQMFLQHCSMP